MQPLVEIRRIGLKAYSYRIGTGGAPVHHADITFDSLEGCILDVGNSLGNYFPQVEISYEGRFLGICLTAALRCTPREVAERIEQGQ